LIELSISFIVTSIKYFDDCLLTVEGLFLKLVFLSLFVIIVDGGEQDIHQKVERKDQEPNKVQTAQSSEVVGQQHHIRKVGRREQNKHLVD